MAIAVFLLLCGMLAAEVALFGFRAAGVVGALLLVLCAVVLMTAMRRGRLFVGDRR